jgi:SAM-dependent methyltransferase
MHTGLTDMAHPGASGEWNLYQCRGCDCAYLDPRPTPESIGLAYHQQYSTYSPRQKAEAGSLGTVFRLRRALANGYRNWRFGTDYRPASNLGIAVALISPRLRWTLDRSFRNLPRSEPGARLLDLGFGGGTFLESARDAGWQVAGADPDSIAVAAALKRGLDVRQGGIETFSDMPGHFDVITINHVIEHVHNPRTTLQTAYQLLKPGGILWLSTPNIQSLSHLHYGRNWYPLDPPRHLMLFNWSAMLSTLREFGFHTRKTTDKWPYENYAAKSELMKQGLDPIAEFRVRPALRLRGSFARMITFFQPDRAEHITLRAYKPLRDS